MVAHRCVDVKLQLRAVNWHATIVKRTWRACNSSYGWPVQLQLQLHAASGCATVVRVVQPQWHTISYNVTIVKCTLRTCNYGCTQLTRGVIIADRCATCNCSYERLGGCASIVVCGLVGV